MNKMSDIESSKIEFWKQCYLVELAEANKKKDFFAGDTSQKLAGRMADLSVKELESRYEALALKKANTERMLNDHR